MPDDPSLLPMFDGSAIRSSAAATDQNGQPVVDFTLSSDAAGKFATYTTNNVGNFFAIVLDGTVISAPSVQSAIGDGHGEITLASGPGAQAAVRSLVADLNAGALPFPLQEVLVSTGASPIPGSSTP